LRSSTTVAHGEGKEHEGEHHLGVGPAREGSKGEMAFDALRSQCVSEIEVEGRPARGGHASGFFSSSYLYGRSPCGILDHLVVMELVS